MKREMDGWGPDGDLADVEAARLSRLDALILMAALVIFSAPIFVGGYAVGASRACPPPPALVVGGLMP